MTSTPQPPGYVRRFARLPQVLEELADYPDGLSLTTLADRVGADAGELHEDLMSFYSADLVEFGYDRPAPGLEFFGDEGDEVDPNEAVIVRIHGDPGVDELGVRYVTAGELALLFAAATRLQELDPDDAYLDAALSILAEAMYGEPTAAPAPRPGRWAAALGPLQTATREQRRARITYSRAWQSGVGDRVIDPYRLVNTRRGWEVDAGPPDEAGRLRTYLLSNIRRVELLEERFELPDDLESRLERQRRTTSVRVRVPQDGRWAADTYAEKVELVTEDELTCTLDLELLPPLGHRVGLLLLVAGDGAEVLGPDELKPAGATLAAQLLEHHLRTTDAWDGSI